MARPSFVDNHLAGPKTPASYLEKHLGATFEKRPNGQLILAYKDGTEVCVEAWQFDLNATFEVVDGAFAALRIPLTREDRFLGVGAHTFDRSVTVYNKTVAALPGFTHFMKPGGQGQLPNIGTDRKGKTWVSSENWHLEWKSGQENSRATFNGNYK